jgi:hypothetical protein
MTPYNNLGPYFTIVPPHKGMYPESPMHQKFVPNILANLEQVSAFTNHDMTRQNIAGYAITYLTKNDYFHTGS